MQVYRSLESARQAQPSAVTIGNFDGAHLGHQALFARTRALAQQHQAMATVLTFDPHPAVLLSPERAPQLLTTLEQRLDAFRRLGIGQTVVLPFTHELSRLWPEEFVVSVLIDVLRTRAVLVGENFRFGHKQTGDVASLRGYGLQLGFATETEPLHHWRGVMASSSEVRKRLLAGDMRVANRILGAPFCLTGSVVPGHGIGKTQTVPTLNLQADQSARPRHGVYVTRTRCLTTGHQWTSITNVGRRPTFQREDVTVETFLLQPLGDETPARIQVEFLHWLREERAFADAAALRQQILRDVARAQRYHQRRQRWAPLPTTTDEQVGPE